MIGPSLYRINHLPLADDYNRMVDAVGPLQNLAVGGNLTMDSLNNAVTIVGNNSSTGDAIFKYPFKVTVNKLSDDTTVAHVEFGRVYEEANFNDNSEDLSFIEISSSTVFHELSGMNVTINTNENDSIIIVRPKDYDYKIASENTYKICLSSTLAGDEDTDQHVIANLIYRTDLSSEDNLSIGCWQVEQVLMGDHTFTRNPPVPWDITRFNNKWVIYIPPESLVINQKDWSKEIQNLTFNVMPLIGYDWYEYKIEKSFLNFKYINSEFTPGSGYGNLLKVICSPEPDYYGEKPIQIADGLKQLLKGSVILEKIRPDSGYDGESKFTSISRQFASTGIGNLDENYTIELHGFADAAQPTKPFELSSGYHTIATREVGDDDVTRLVWVSMSSLSNALSNTLSSISEELSTVLCVELNNVVDIKIENEISVLSSLLSFPFQVSKSELTENGCKIKLGRVYEYGSVESVQQNGQIQYLPILELNYVGAQAPGEWLETGVLSDDYIVATYNYSNGFLNKFYLELETSAKLNGRNVIRRIAKLTTKNGVQNIEQIHTGDISFTPPTIRPFSIAKYLNELIFYCPTESIILNGVDYTADAVSELVQAINDWYYLPGGFGQLLNLVIDMNHSSNLYGMVSKVRLDSGSVYGDSEQIVIKIFDSGFLKYYHIGQINREFIRPDTSLFQIGHWYNSIEISPTGKFLNGDRTLQLHGFLNSVAPTVSVDTDGYSHSFAVREQGPNNTELRWLSYSTLAKYMEDIAESAAVNVIDSNVDSNFNNYLDNHFWGWWDEQNLSGLGNFWEQGGDYSSCYGTGVGNSGQQLAIDLDNQILNNSWSVAGNLIFPTNGNIGTDSCPAASLNLTGVINISGIQVICEQQNPIANATSGNDVVSVVNQILTALRIHGLIET